MSFKSKNDLYLYQQQRTITQKTTIMPKNETQEDSVLLNGSYAYVLQMVTAEMIKCRCNSVTGVELSIDTIRKIRQGARSQTTPTGKLVMNTLRDIVEFLSNTNN